MKGLRVEQLNYDKLFSHREGKQLVSFTLNNSHDLGKDPSS